MTADPNRFLFPSNAVPHTRFTAKHGFIMATVNKAIRNGATSLRILEVGSWLGASTLLWGESIRYFGGEHIARNSRILAIDSWRPILSSEDLKFEEYQDFANAAKNDFAYNIFLHNAKLGSKMYGVEIESIRGSSEDILPSLERSSHDIVYIDASHYYDDVIYDINEAKTIVRNGGIICGDDLNLELSQVDAEITATNGNRDCIIDERSGQWYHPGVTRAVGESFPEVGCLGGFWTVAKLSDTAFAPNEVRFDGLFVPSFLSPEDQTFFCDTVNQYVKPKVPG